MIRTMLAATFSAAVLTLAAPALARDARFVRAPAIGCTDRGLMEHANEWRDDGRGYDYQSLMRVALDSGQCRRLAPGVLVVVEDSDIVGGLTKVRAQGEPLAVWVRDNALSDD